MVKQLIRSLLFFQFLVSQGSVLLVGGGSENYGDWSDVPYTWLVDHAPNKKILVLHYSTVSTFLPDYFKSLGAVQSVSIAITSVTANDSAVAKMILEYDGIFLRGGDQWEYIKQWKGTLTEQAIKTVYQRGGAIGGTSAGAMVLSKIIADAKSASVDPRTALRTPFSAGITFTEDFLGFASGILCDTHFYERGRLSRLLAMLAMYHHQSGKWITGVGIDDATALGITSNGIAEVFGSGVVSIIIPDNATSASTLPGRPLGISDMFMRQFIKGTRISLPDGAIKSLPSMVSFTPKPVSNVQKRVILDGGISSVEWSGASGSLMKMVIDHSGDTIGIYTTPPVHSNIAAVQNFLSSKNIPSTIILVSPAARNSAEPTSLFSNRSTIVIAHVPADSLSFFTDTASVTGKAFRAVSGKTVLLLGDAASYAGTAFVNKLEVTTTAAYRGRLTVERGLGVINGMMVLPRQYESDSYIENRSCGLPWGIGKVQPSYGIYLDNNSHCVIENNIVTAFGATPALLFDLRQNTLTAFPSYVASGGIGPRQNAAFNSASLNVLSDSNSIDLGRPSGIELLPINSVPLQHEVLNIYPNPFNPTAKIDFILRSQEFVTITVSDILGRTVRTIARREFPSGRHTLEFSAGTFPSGIYFFSLSMNGIVLTKKAMLTK